MDPQLFVLLRGFYSLTPISKLEFPKDLTPRSINTFLLSDILLDHHFQRYPPSRQYQKQFWKWVIANLEQMPIEDDDEDFEVDLNIYKHYFALLPPGGPAIGSSHPDTRDQTCGRGLAFHAEPPSSSYVTHFWTSNPAPDSAEPEYLIDLKNYQRTTILESRTMIEGGTTGLRTWLASFVLAQYLINHPDIVSSSRVLELGSGTGFLGIVVATLQSLHGISSSQSQDVLWLTDVSEEVLARCRHNLHLHCNASSTARANITYSELDWADSLDSETALVLHSLIQEKVKPTVILGADVAFDPTVIPSLIGTLKIALQPRGSDKRAIIAMAMRNPSTLQKFIDQASAVFQMEVIDVELQRQVFWETMEGSETKQNVKSFSIRLL